MARIRRTGFSDFEKAEIWRGWKSGKTLNKIALQLNQRPRKTLGFRCPADKFGECVALTA